MREAFEKQTETIEDQGKKQIKAIQDKGPIKPIEKCSYDINDSSMVLKEKEIYNKLTEECFEKINNLDKKIDPNKLLFKYKGKTADQDFSKFDNTLVLIDKLRNGEFSLNGIKDEQTKLRTDLWEIRKVQKKYLLKESKKT